ncbi:MAG: hypothetical protein K0S22_1749 [Oscillospiraceae bacterium]|nr:hypothetical protein [Oscillospiraceae bacterium]
MPNVLIVCIALLVGFTAGMLYKWLQIMFFNGYLAYREFFNSWVRLIPNTATHDDIENISRLIIDYFWKKQIVS